LDQPSCQPSPAYSADLWQAAASSKEETRKNQGSSEAQESQIQVKVTLCCCKFVDTSHLPVFKQKKKKIADDCQ
jgi:hypothetical protein